MCEWDEIRGDCPADGGGTPLWATGVDIDGVKVRLIAVKLCRNIM